jgi:GDP-L-fucose synthase
MIKRLITGGSGLVGSNIEAEIKLGSIDGDLRDWSQVKNIFEKYRPTHVVHAAARVGGVGGNMRAKGEFFYDNIMINTNVLEACRIYNVKKVVSFLSTCIFPESIEYPLTEKKIHLGAPHWSNYGYAYSKRMLDVQTEVYRDQYKVDFVSVIPTNIYGLNDNFNLDSGHVIPSLIHKCYLAKTNNTDFNVWGSGTPLREFIYSKDIGKLTNWALENYDESEPIIFSTSQEISIKDLVGLIVSIIGFEGDVVWQSDKPDGQFRKPSSNKKLMSYVPDFKFTPIEVGLKETIEHFTQNYPNLRGI